MLITLSDSFQHVSTLIWNKSDLARQSDTLKWNVSTQQSWKSSQIWRELECHQDRSFHWHLDDRSYHIMHNCPLCKLSCNFFSWRCDNTFWKPLCYHLFPSTTTALTQILNKTEGVSMTGGSFFLQSFDFSLHFISSYKHNAAFNDLSVYSSTCASSSPHPWSFRCPWQSLREPHLLWHMVYKASFVSEWPCLELWLSVVPKCLWQHRDRGMKGLEKEGEGRYSDRRRVGVGAEEGAEAGHFALETHWQS